MADTESVGTGLRDARKRLGLSQKALSEKLQLLGIPETSFGSIRRYETGEKSPSVVVLEAIAGLAGVSSASLVAGTSRPSETLESSPWPPPDGLKIVGQLEAELMRREDGDDIGGPQEAFEVVEDRVRRMRAEGRLGDEGWYYWLALKHGAVLSGGYDPPGFEPPESDLDSSDQSIA